MYILFFLIPIAVWIVVAKLIWHHHFTAKEVVAQTIPTILVITTLFVVSDMYQTYDTKIINGEVTSKNPKKQNCPIGWVKFTDSHCTEYVTRIVKVGETCSTNSEGKRTCTPKYDTEYNYIYPWERRYFVYSDIDETFEIRRVDRQGVTFPPRFTKTEIGDPVATTKPFKNYVLAASSSLFNVGNYEELDMDSIPYPSIYDYYKVNRVIDMTGEQDPDFISDWNNSLAKVNRDIKNTQANVIILLTNEDVSFAEKLQIVWQGHNINDVIVAVGVQGSRIEWVDVKSWSSESMVNISLRDDIKNIGTIEDFSFVNKAIYENVLNYFKVQTEQDFEYLSNDIKPPMLTLVLAFIVLLVLTPTVTYVFVKKIDLK